MREADAAVARAPGRGATPYSLYQMILYAATLGSFGFGGPVALVGAMRRDLVERRGWITEADYNQGLALAELAPGPLAGQLAMYLGYLHHRRLGAALVGTAFIFPSFLMVVALGWAYTLYGGLPWIHACFYGVGASVIGIIAHSAYRLTTRTIRRDWLLWALYLLMAATTILTASEPVLLVLVAGILVWLVRTPPRLPRPWRRRRAGRLTAIADPVRPQERQFGVLVPVLASIAAATATTSWLTLWNLFAFFTEAGAVVFGSGLAIVPFLYAGVVHDHQWLTNQQFVDAVAVALITPGPVVITAAFIGFLVAGLPGAGVAALGAFLPAYLFTVVLAPLLRRHGKRPGVAAFVQGVTAAAIGAITGSVFVLARQAIVDLPTALLALATLGLLWRASKIPTPVVVLGAALAGLLVFHFRQA